MMAVSAVSGLALLAPVIAVVGVLASGGLTVFIPVGLAALYFTGSGGV